MAENLILFDEFKNPPHTINKGLKTFANHLRKTLNSNEFLIESQKTSITNENLSLNNVRLLIFAHPREKFNVEEINCLVDYIHSGGSIMFMGSESYNEGLLHNLNFLIEKISDMAITLNNDSVLRTKYHKYAHPKECLFSTHNKYIVNQGLVNSLSNNRIQSKIEEFLFPYGCSLNLNLDTSRPAIPLMSSGPAGYPPNRPIGAAALMQPDARNHRADYGRLVVLGSTLFCHDAYIGPNGSTSQTFSSGDYDSAGTKLGNLKILENLVKWLVKIPSTEHNNVPRIIENFTGQEQFNDYNQVPSIEALAQDPKGVLQSGENSVVSSSVSAKELMERTANLELHAIDTSLLIKAHKFHEKFEIKKENLSLIPPNFECPLPPLQAAVFPAIFDENAGPALDLFDLDSEMAPVQNRLAHLTNKHVTEELDYYITECGRVLENGNEKDKGNTRKHAKDILHSIAEQLAKCKRSDFTAH